MGGSEGFGGGLFADGFGEEGGRLRSGVSVNGCLVNLSVKDNGKSWRSKTQRHTRKPT